MDSFITLSQIKGSLVRHKFAEVKRLCMDEDLRRSKQFHDALEVLNGNKDLFLKCLQESNSVLSEDVHTREFVPPHREANRITVLRPSKVVDTVDNSEKLGKKGAFDVLNVYKNSQLVDSSPASWKNYDNPSQPTRIIILKPSPVKFHDTKAVMSPEFFGNAADNGNQESKPIPQRMHEKVVWHSKDDALISSHGYIDAESSFKESETDSIAGNVSDMEVMSPVSRHSWDYVNNRFGSPYSSPSFGKEAKKRLSERWATVASNVSFLERRHVCRSSSTLGEMLALSETKKPLMPGKERVLLNDSVHSNAIELETPESVADPHLTRSKSVPVSFVNGRSLFNVESPKAETKEKQCKSSSFTGKVSGLFFSRNKKACKDKYLSSESKDEFCSEPVSRLNNSLGSASCSKEGPRHLSSSVQKGYQGASWHETGLPIGKLNSSGNICENLDQPSPVSVLDQPFEVDLCSRMAFSRKSNAQVDSIRSNLIDKSPPIGSIARNLSWKDTYVNPISSYPSNQSTGREIERQWFLFVRALLSTADMLGEMELNSFLARWHSLDSPLDPSLRDEYMDRKDMETKHEARRRQNRSTQKLIFDCVNTSLIKIAGYGSLFGQSMNSDKILEHSSISVLKEVWSEMSSMFCSEIKCVFEDCMEEDALVLERMVMKELAGKDLDDHLRMVVDNIARELEEKVMEELVGEAMAELSLGA